MDTVLFCNLLSLEKPTVRDEGEDEEESTAEISSVPIDDVNFSVVITSLSATSLTLNLSWTLRGPSMTVLNYTVSYTNTNNTDCFNNVNNVTGIPSNATTHALILTGLQEATEYSITVTVVLSNEEVVIRNLFTATMADGGLHSIHCLSMHVSPSIILYP